MYVYGPYKCVYGEYTCLYGLRLTFVSETSESSLWNSTHCVDTENVSRFVPGFVLRSAETRVILSSP